MAETVSNVQRALWTFLIYTLAGPFFGAMAVAAVLIVVPLAGLGAALPPGLPPIGLAAVTAYVWCALPAALSAVSLVPLILRRGTFGPVEAASAGVIAFAASTLFMTVPLQSALPYMAFLAGLVSLLLRLILVRARILIPPGAKH